jgi:AraC-like DNA-binding protein
VRVDAAVDGDELMMSVPGAGGALVRTGQGSDVTRVAARQVATGHLALLEFGFPMVGSAHTEGDHLIVCHMLRTPPGARWDGTGLLAGQSFIYPPGSSQVATDPEGLTFGMAVVPWLDLEAAATALGFDVDAASVPHVQPPSGTNPLLELFRGLDSRTPLRRSRRAKIDPDLMLDAVARIACQRPPPAPRRRARWDSRDLVEETAAWLDASARWQVPMLTLCREVGVSERRLQLAFREVYDTTPTQFMRLRALQAAHRALHSADPESVRVAQVASAHGFSHGGRFALLHHAVYGTSPSMALRER